MVTTLKVPKPHPMEKAWEKWQSCKDFQKLQAFRKTDARASKRLRRAKAQTGLAIVGSPPISLTQDGKLDQATLGAAMVA